MSYTKPQIAQIEADAEFWREWGGAFGLTLTGFTDRHSAAFVDHETNAYITIKNVGYAGETNFQFFDRLRKQLLGS